MKFEGSGSKGTRVIERKRSVTDGQTDRRTDGQGKNNMSPPEGGRHNLLTAVIVIIRVRITSPKHFNISSQIYKNNSTHLSTMKEIA